MLAARGAAVATQTGGGRVGGSRRNAASPAVLRAARRATPAARPTRGPVCSADGKPPHLSVFADRNIVDLSSTPGIQFYKVEAIIRPWRLDYVLKALDGEGIRGLTATAVGGIGAQGGTIERSQGSEFGSGTLVDKYKIEIVVVKEQVNDVVNIVIDAAATGELGDGKIFIIPVSEVIRIRTREHGAAAERMEGGRMQMLSGFSSTFPPPGLDHS